MEMHWAEPGNVKSWNEAQGTQAKWHSQQALIGAKIISDWLEMSPDRHPPLNKGLYSCARYMKDTCAVVEALSFLPRLHARGNTTSWNPTPYAGRLAAPRHGCNHASRRPIGPSVSRWTTCTGEIGTAWTSVSCFVGLSIQYRSSTSTNFSSVELVTSNTS
jgi:hypothetical protein